MLSVNQLSGFGGGLVIPGLLVSTGSSPNTDNPTFTVDLGPPGVKQVLCVFVSSDEDGSDPWDWSTGSVGGEAFTYVVAAGAEKAGNGSSFTGGATIRTLETELSGPQTVAISISGFSGTMTNNRMLALVVRGYNATPIAYDGGDDIAGDGNDFTISTVGARLVIGGAAFGGSPGNLQGPGSGEVTPLTGAQYALGYDLVPAGTAGNVYSFSGGSYVIAGASFG